MTVFCDNRHDDSPFLELLLLAENEEEIESPAEKLSLTTPK
jgi:hypothetical protein